jgi:hypothetical protein
MKFQENLQEIIKKRLFKLNAERLWLESVSEYAEFGQDLLLTKSN